MHVLFLSRPDHDHLYLTLPVAEELGRRGHTVTFATGDPFAEEDAGSGVVLLRYGRDERALLDLPAFTARGPVDLVVCDPRTRPAAAELAREWGVRLVVAHTNLAAGGPVAWPVERSFGTDYVYVHPTGRGRVFGEWAPAGPRPVVAVAHPGLPAAVLDEAFDAADWQVVLVDRGVTVDLPERIAATPGFTPLRHADVLVSDGGLAGIAAALRYAVPVVFAPLTPEGHRNAARIVGLGLGLLLGPDGLRPASLRRTVSRLSVDEATRAAARRLRALVRAAGAPARVCDVLESDRPEQRARAA